MSVNRFVLALLFLAHFFWLFQFYNRTLHIDYVQITLYLFFLIQSLFLIVISRRSSPTDQKKDLGETKYRVMKMLFRKYMHDVANKVQIFMVQQSLARKQVESSGELNSYLEKIKLTAQEQSEHLKWTRQHYLNRADYFILCDEVDLQIILTNIHDYFSKRSQDKDVKLQISELKKDYKVKIEMSSFSRYVLHPLLGYVTEASQAGAYVQVEAQPLSSSQISLDLHFSGLDESQLNQIASGMLSSGDEDNIFLVASDFLILQEGKLSLVKSPRFEKGGVFSLVLTII